MGRMVYESTDTGRRRSLKFDSIERNTQSVSENFTLAALRPLISRQDRPLRTAAQHQCTIRREVEAVDCAQSLEEASFLVHQ
jgi:hypothetical protein